MDQKRIADLIRCFTVAVILLLPPFADANTPQNPAMNRELFAAIQTGNQNRLTRAIAGGADINRRNAVSGYSPLDHAVEFGQLGIVKALIAAGCEVNGKALLLAAQTGHADIISVLVQAGADVNVTDNNGNTPLHLAAGRSLTEAVKALLEAHSNPNALNNMGRTPFELASRIGVKQLIANSMPQADAIVHPAAVSHDVTPPAKTAEEPHQPDGLRIVTAPVVHATSELVQIAGRVTGGGTAVALGVEGNAVPIKDDGSFAFQRVVLVGESEMELVAKSDGGQVAAVTIKIVRSMPVIAETGYAPLDPTRLRGIKRPDAIALIIGVDHYQNAPDAEFAENDARAFYDYATRAIGVPRDRVKLLIASDARRLDIQKALRTWLSPLVVKGRSEVYVFFSGHGLASDNGKDLFLLPYDGDHAVLADSAIRRKELIDTVIASGAVSATLFLDTCYSGGTRGTATLMNESRPIMIVPNEETIPPNITILAAAANDQLSSALPSVKHGLFSYFLMKGLEGNAAGSDHTITAANLEKYLMDHIPSEAAKLGRTQTPQMMGDGMRVVSSW